MNLYLLDESEKPLVFFGNESYKYKESGAIVLTCLFVSFLTKKKENKKVLRKRSLNSSGLFYPFSACIERQRDTRQPQKQGLEENKKGNT